jgi:hypothetical protein
MARKGELTPKQRKFAKRYVKTGNATKAAKDAGYSPRTAYSIGSENLTKPEIKAYMDSLAAEAEIVEGLTIPQIAAMTLNEAKNADHAGARVRAQELLLKWKGAFIDKIEDVTRRENDATALIARITALDPAAGAALERALGLDEQKPESDQLH